MFTIPCNLKSLADICARGDQLRYGATSGVQVVDIGESRFRAEATDGRVAVRVEGPAPKADHYANIPAIVSAPNGATSAIIDRKSWAGMFVRQKTPIGIVAGEKTATIATDNGATVRTETTTDGRFPNLSMVIPGADADVVAKVRIDAEYLIRVLKAVSDAAPGDDAAEVDLIIHQNQRSTTNLGLVSIRSKTTDGTEAIGLVVPIGPAKTT